MNCRRLQQRGPARCKRAVNGLVVAFACPTNALVGTVAAGVSTRGALGVKRYMTSAAPTSPRSQAQRWGSNRSAACTSPSSSSAGSYLLVPAVQCSAARSARPTQGRTSRLTSKRAPRFQAGLDRPSTVLPSQEAVPILGMVRFAGAFLRQRSSPVRAETRGFRPGGARSRGQCSPRDRARSSPVRRGAAQEEAIFNSAYPLRSPLSASGRRHVRVTDRDSPPQALRNESQRSQLRKQSD